MSDLRESLTQSGTLYGFINTIVYAHDYADLTNKPQINGVTLIGNKTASELGLVTPATEAVQSVNGETGAVVLDGNDIDYDSTKTINQQIDAVAALIPVIPVTSVNGETGDVVLDGSDIRYDADYTVSAKIDAVAADIPVVDYPVTSVNEKTGDVVLDGDDIAYNSSLSVNQKIDAVEAAIPVVDYPVTSVAGKTGAVELYASDILIQDTASGAIANFNTSLTKNLVDCTVESGANIIYVRGKNLINISNTLENTYINVNTTYPNGKVASISGANVFYAEVPKNTDIIWSSDAGNRLVISGYYTRPETLADSTADVLFNNSPSFVASKTFNTGNCTFIVIYPNRDQANKPTQIQLELGTTATAFESYNPASTNYPVANIDTIRTLQGINNIFADTGNISVTYIETIKDYIDKAVAT